MQLLSTVSVTRRRRKRSSDAVPRLELTEARREVDLVVHLGDLSWTRTIKVGSRGELFEAFAADVNWLAEHLWGTTCVL